ncbi:conserved exported hypothetical protein [Candidatus Terasakiella magnetica]|nr:conserved exported hypothetical protein [Candidatus Terasakiella magnetica]
MLRPLLALGLLLAAAPAQAHKLKVFATAEGAWISGTAYFSGGAKAMGIDGTVQAPDGMVLGTLKTDAGGGFGYEARTRMDHTLILDGGDGHAARAVIAAAELPASLPEGMAGAVLPPPARPVAAGADIDTDAIEAAVARQIRPLRQQLDAYEERVRLHDLLGGVGVIFGIFGLAAWLSARRRMP